MKWFSIFLALFVSAAFVSVPAAAKKDPAAAAAKAAKKAWLKAETKRLNDARQAEKAQLKQNLADAKARVKRGENVVKAQEKIAKQASRDELRLRKDREKAREPFVKAMDAYNANPTDQNKFAFRAAEANYLPKKAAHEAAVPIANAANAKLTQYQGQKAQAILQATQAKQAVKKGPAPIAKPIYTANAVLPKPLSVGQYDVVPALAPVVYGQLPPAPVAGGPAPAGNQAGLQRMQPLLDRNGNQVLNQYGKPVYDFQGRAAQIFQQNAAAQ